MAVGGEHGSTAVASAHGVNRGGQTAQARFVRVRFSARRPHPSVSAAEGHREMEESPWST